MFSNNYTKFEGFTNTYGYNENIRVNTTDKNVLASNMSAIKNMEIDLPRNMDNLQKNNTSIAGTVNTYAIKKDELLNNNARYDFLGKTFLYTNQDKKTEDVILEDTNALLLQQNMMYMMGSITAVSLLIVALLAGAKE